MPRLAKNNRWRHPIYKNAYCYRRSYGSDAVYMSVNGIRKASNIRWNENNRQIALEALDEFYHEINTPQATPHNMKLLEAVKLFIKESQTTLDDFTIKHYLAIFSRIFLIDMPLSNVIGIKEMVTQAFNNYYADKAANTKNKAMQRLSRFFDYCVENDYIDKNPITKNLIPKREKVPVLTYTFKQIEIILNYFETKNERMYYYIKFALLTGVRVGEFLNLQWSDFSDKAIHLKMTKTKTPRVFPIAHFEELTPVISKLRELNPDKPCALATKDAVRSILYRAFREIEQIHNIDLNGLSFHNFRKTAINIWRDLGIEAEIRALMAGHSIKEEYESYLSDPNSDFYEKYFTRKPI